MLTKSPSLASFNQSLEENYQSMKVYEHEHDKFNDSGAAMDAIVFAVETDDQLCPLDMMQMSGGR